MAGTDLGSEFTNEANSTPIHHYSSSETSTLATMCSLSSTLTGSTVLSIESTTSTGTACVSAPSSLSKQDSTIDRKSTGGTKSCFEHDIGSPEPQSTTSTEIWWRDTTPGPNTEIEPNPDTKTLGPGTTITMSGAATNILDETGSTEFGSPRDSGVYVSDSNVAKPDSPNPPISLITTSSALSDSSTSSADTVATISTISTAATGISVASTSKQPTIQFQLPPKPTQSPETSSETPHQTSSTPTRTPTAKPKLYPKEHYPSRSRSRSPSPSPHQDPPTPHRKHKPFRNLVKHLLSPFRHHLSISEAALTHDDTLTTGWVCCRCQHYNTPYPFRKFHLPWLHGRGPQCGRCSRHRKCGSACQMKLFLHSGKLAQRKLAKKAELLEDWVRENEGWEEKKFDWKEQI
ncbi:hypothetical protein EX30DRAFT_5037 [Ascodesmis nigricans]|uniref:Uncharacterized protein n=1 Tax=Ascodesmis nigricans TaxID=341454 RepID=A0A4S2N5S8_9PEZI|nr:hypothetical protein EX30DRAFT_5037 [Ascodesmis nigricans]